MRHVSDNIENTKYLFTLKYIPRTDFPVLMLAKKNLCDTMFKASLKKFNVLIATKKHSTSITKSKSSTVGISS